MTVTDDRVLVGSKPRLRRGWRATGYLIVLMPMAAGLALLGRGSVGTNVAVHALVAAAAIGLAYVFRRCIDRRWIDRRSWADIGLPVPVRACGWWQAAVGFGWGAGAIGAYFVVAWALGWARVTGTELRERGLWGMLALLAVGLFLYATSAVFQEVAFRGYVLSTLADGWSMRGAAIVSSVVFAALHVTGGSSPLMALVVVVDLSLMAGFLVLTRLSTGALWLAIGFHTAWNWAQDYVFSLDTDAGPDYGNALVHVRLQGSGPELLYLLFSGLLCGGYWLWTHRSARSA